MRRLPFLVFFLLCSGWAQRPAVTYASLAEGQTVSGFRAAAVYLNDSGRPMGARFRHLSSGFTLDLLEIQSVPQGFIWATTYPTSNMGEPHTQEHLLLGKGNKGHALGSQEVLSLVNSSAFTAQHATCYHFYTSAGPNAFHDYFEHAMDAFLHPDYSDEEVRREVRNFGVAVNPADGSLRLEEKGTVYNEMVTSMDQPNWRLLQAAAVTVYGPEHPLAFSSGGLPAALRIIRPADIRRFHAQHYFLGNMGMIASLPKEMALAPTLAKLDSALHRLEPRAPRLPIMNEEQLPAPRPAAAGRIEYVHYPSKNDQQPGWVALVWPAERKLNHRDLLLFTLFLSNLAGDPDTNLYQRLIDTRTRETDFGATRVNAFADTDQGHPVYVLFEDVPVARMNDKELNALRGRVLDELARIGAYPDGSPELAQFNARLKGRILQQRREFAKFVNSPPGFGFRSKGDDWLVHLSLLNKEQGFRKALTAKAELDELEKLAGSTRNVWRDYLAQWKMTGALPWIEAALPDPGLMRQEDEERAARAAAEVARLKEAYGVSADQQAIQRYQAEYDSASLAIENAAKTGAPPKFVDNPPLTLDDPLEYSSHAVAGGVPLVTSAFGSMTSATAGIALRLDGVPEDQLVYLAMLPQLLTGAGVIENGKAVSYQTMSQRLRDEILKLDSNFRINPLTDRYELVVRGSGSNAAEARRALDWIQLALFHPDWRPENLPRLRDLVDQTLGALRNTTQFAEESWVDDPALAYRRQDSPLLLATSSFLTREHSLLRLRWMLKEGGSEEFSRFLESLSTVGGSRSERQALLASIESGSHTGAQGLPAPAKALAVAAAQDLQTVLSGLPDSSIAADWTAVCHQMSQDLRTGPTKTLAALDAVRRSLLTTAGARLFLIASPETQKALAGGLEELPRLLDPAAGKKAVYRPGRRIEERLRRRDPDAAHPVFVGLLNANTQGGVFLNSSPGASFRDTSNDALLDFLASNLYAGHGAHSMFMKTWGAGLAYSNGIRIRPLAGRVNYYAERTPELPQTLQFVIGELKKAKPDPALADYAIANAFDGARSAESYETRGESMAEDLADGLTPAVVTGFHRALLELRRRPDLTAELFRRMPKVYEKILPGMGTPARDVPGGVFFVIGPEKQLAAYEQYLKTVEGPETHLFRLYPRDFWLE